MVTQHPFAVFRGPLRIKAQDDTSFILENCLKWAPGGLVPSSMLPPRHFLFFFRTRVGSFAPRVRFQLRTTWDEISESGVSPLHNGCLFSSKFR